MKKDGGEGSLKGSKRYSVWQRHTFMSPHVTMQPEGLQQNHGMRHIVAALQAAFDGVVSSYPGRCHWATSVAALLAAFIVIPKALPLGYIYCSLTGCIYRHTQGVAIGLHLLQFYSLHIWAMPFTQGVAIGLYLLQPYKLLCCRSPRELVMSLIC